VKRARRTPSAQTRVRAWALVASVLTATSGARAQDGPYANFLVGEHALGLAGSFVAVADDASAGFHNPAGLALLPHSTASGSVLAGGLQVRRLRLGYATRLGQSDLEYDAAPTLAPFLGGALKLGKRGADGVAPFGFGLSLLTPHQDDYRSIAQLQANDPDVDVPGVDRLEVRHGDRAQWYGLSFGARVARRVGLGLSTFLATRNVGHDEVEIRAREGLLADLPEGANHTRTGAISASAEHVVLRAGALWDASRRVRLGLLLQPPGIELGARARYDLLDTSADPTGAAFSASEADARTHLPIPWEVRGGVAWRNPRTSLLSFDVSVLGPAGSARDPLPLVERPGSTGPFGLFVPEVAYRQVAVRSAVGFELVAGERFPIRGGVLVERSSAPKVPGSATVYARERVHTVGGALSFGWRSGSYDVSIGATGLYGVGEGLGVVQGMAADAPRYRATDIEDATLLVFVTGARQAVQQIASTVSSDAPRRKPRR
jgi:hypothetical protein